MYKGNIIGIAIPAYNVAAQIGAVLAAVPEFVDHVVVVDDASVDGTAAAAGPFIGGRVILISHDKNRGVGAAVKTGFQQLFERGAGILVKVDGDGQMDLHHLPKLLDPLVDGHYTYAKGNRFLHSKDIHAMPRVRLLGNIALTFLTKMCSGYWNVFDPQNGYLAIRSETLALLPLDHISDRYFFENDMLVHLNIYHLPVKDVPMPAIYGNERSSLKIRQILLTFPLHLLARTLYRLYQKYVLHDFSQIAVFLLVGFLLMAWGVIFGGYHWYRSVMSDHAATTGTVMLALLPFLMGFELFLQGIILDIQSTPK